MKTKKLHIFYDRDSRGALPAVERGIRREYELTIEGKEEKEPIKIAYSSKRNQYDASLLLSSLLKSREEVLLLHVISKDIYVDEMNFIFGIAQPGRGAVLSISRLRSDELIEKEAVHEIGHVLGLRHCRNECVMQFSNTVFDAELKPTSLCDDCKRRLKRIRM